MKILARILTWLFIVSLPLFFRPPPFGSRLAVPSCTSSSLTSIMSSRLPVLIGPASALAANGLVDYFNSNQQYIDVVVTKDGEDFTLFNEREVEHLKDVKELFSFDLRVLWMTGAIIIVFLVVSQIWLKDGRIRLARAALWGSGLTVALMVAMGLGMMLDFDSLLLRFHLFSFANDLWLLDPSRDYLIMLITGGSCTMPRLLSPERRRWAPSSPADSAGSTYAGTAQIRPALRSDLTHGSSRCPRYSCSRGSCTSSSTLTFGGRLAMYTTAAAVSSLVMYGSFWAPAGRPSNWTSPGQRHPQLTPYLRLSNAVD